MQERYSRLLERDWGTAFWKWDYRDADTADFNLVNDAGGKLVPTQSFGILEDPVRKGLWFFR